MTDNKAKDTAFAFLQSQLMDDETDYRRRGRKFEMVAISELQNVWIAAVHAMAQPSADLARVRNFEDLSAEFRIRGIDPPVDSVTPEIIALQKSAVDQQEDWMPKLARQIERLLADRAKPKN
jgi:hypothetical protein